jgi:hypothetical protein
METSLHRQIKRLVARDEQSMEVTCGSYRIDAIDTQGRFVEVQYGPLRALRPKILALRTDHSLRIIKPVAVQKQLVTIHPKTKEILRSRKSPKRESPLEIFEELLHFTQCFPHPNLVLECWLVRLSETRIDRPPSKRRRRKFSPVDVHLIETIEQFQLRSNEDLVRLLGLPKSFDNPFCTATLSQQLQLPRWFAQQIAYVLHRCGAANRVGKRGNSHLYAWCENVVNSCAGARRSRRIAA